MTKSEMRSARGLRRRAFVAGCGMTLSAVLLPSGLSRATGRFPLQLSESEWRERLSEREFLILREAGTEPPGASDLLNEKREGTYICAGCDQELFSSKTKFESGTGWPSFWAPISEDAIALREDRSWLVVVRTEVLCSRCGGHLGHVFDDGPEPTGLRYCMNGWALDFVPAPA